MKRLYHKNLQSIYEKRQHGNSGIMIDSMDGTFQNSANLYETILKIYIDFTFGAFPIRPARSFNLSAILQFYL